MSLMFAADKNVSLRIASCRKHVSNVLSSDINVSLMLSAEKHYVPKVCQIAIKQKCVPAVCQINVST